MTAVDVAAIRAALEAATPGPWVHDAERIDNAEGAWIGEAGDPADAELIVLLRNNAEALLDHGKLVDRLAAVIESQRDRALEALADAERRGAERAWEEGWRAGAGDQMTGRAPSENPYERGEVSP